MKANCQQFEQDVDALLDQTLPVHMADALLDHLRTCCNCQSLLKQESKLRLLLAGQVVPPMRANFAAQALANARMQHEANQAQQQASMTQHRPASTGFFAGFAYAIATVTIAWIGISQFINAKQSSDPIQTVSMSLGEVKNVNLVFNSPEVMHDVTVAINLPEHTELQGRSGVNSLKWKTTLKQGKNIISLPVIAQQEKSGVIVTRISSGNQSKVFKVRLNVNPRQSPALDKAFLKTETLHKGVLI